eukprot:gene21223-22036_t
MGDLQEFRRLADVERAFVAEIAIDDVDDTAGTRVHERQLRARALVAFAPRQSDDFERQHDIGDDRAPGIERRGLEDIAVVTPHAGNTGPSAVENVSDRSRASMTTRPGAMPRFGLSERWSSATSVIELPERQMPVKSLCHQKQLAAGREAGRPRTAVI